MGRIKRKRAFKDAQNAQIHIILRMLAFAYHPGLCSQIIHSVVFDDSVKLADSNGPDQTAHPRSLIRAFTVRT